jgi:hypothetical protein
MSDLLPLLSQNGTAWAPGLLGSAPRLTTYIVPTVEVDGLMM